MYCNKCGVQLELNQSFCHKCGSVNNEFIPKMNIEINTNNVETFNNSNNKCQRCGAIVFKSDEFCNNCGKKQLKSGVNNSDKISNNNTFVINDDVDYCGRCGTSLPKNQSFCHECGATNSVPLNQNHNKKLNLRIILSGIAFAFILIIISNSKVSFFLPEVSDNEINRNYYNDTLGKYETAIVHTNQYNNLEYSSDEDAVNLIIKDSVSQKSKCPQGIVEIENEFIKKYNITAVNLCEMNIEFSKELLKVYERVYSEFPSISKNFTNLSIGNMEQSNIIAYFQAGFPFATTNSKNEWPIVFKTQIILNADFYLNDAKFENTVKNGSRSGHFPPNATKYSPLAHELAHYISYFACMKHHGIKSTLTIDFDEYKNFERALLSWGNGEYSLIMITEAYKRYVNDTGSKTTIDKFRSTISGYAMAKDENGEYIYDETIAEAFHDVYLNGNNASTASKYIYQVLKEKVEG